MAPFKKTFGALRRKSTGNVLEDAATADSAQPSFRVITREDMDARKHSGRHIINLDDRRDPRLRGSQASSALTRVGADTAASSVRYSSASTVPSSFEIDDSYTPPRLTNRNGSTSLRSPHGSPEPRAEESSTKTYHSSNLSRERAMTTSSYASTAVAPQLETSIPISETSLESDFGNMFSGLSLGDRKSNNATPQPLTQPPPRAFVRADSEPQMPTRKPVGKRSDLSSMPSPVRVDTGLSTESPALSPALQSRKSTDRLMYSSASGASSPGSPPPVPPHSEKPANIRNEQSRQTSFNSNNKNGTAPVNSADSRSQPSAQRATALNSSRDAPSNAASHSRLGSTDSFNASALTYPQSSQNQGTRKMTQKDFEVAKKQEQYEEKVRMRRGDTLDEDDMAEYDDMDDEEELRKAAKRRERQQALLSVHRQSVAKSVGRETSSAFSSDMNNLFSDSTTAGASLSLNYRSSSTPEVILKKDSHMLQYAHNTPDIKPPQLSDYIRPAGDQRTRSFSGVRFPSGSSESDEDVPLGQILLTKYLTKNPEEMHRLSTAGSLARGSASIVPGLHGISLPNPPRPSSRQSQVSRPSSRASKSLPPFARNAPHPDDLPLMPGFQQGSYFPMPAPQLNYSQQYGAAAGFTQPQVSYQNSFGGQYTPQPGTPGAPTLMDGLQREEKMKKWRHQNTNQGRTMTLPNMAPPQMAPPQMAPPQMFNPQMGMGYMGMPQQQQMGMGMGMMGMGMGMGMGMPMMPQQMPPPMPQMSPQQMAAMGMNMGMMNMNMNMMGAGMNMGQNGNARFQGAAGQGQRVASHGSLGHMAGAQNQSLPVPAPMSGLPGGYAPSIAPSERSNIGIPNRYRPITTINDGASAVGGAELIQPGGAVGEPEAPDKKKKGVKAWLGKRMGGADGAGEEEYDAEGEGEEWGNMRKSRVLRTQKV